VTQAGGVGLRCGLLLCAFVWIAVAKRQVAVGNALAHGCACGWWLVFVANALRMETCVCVCVVWCGVVWCMTALNERGCPQPLMSRLQLLALLPAARGVRAAQEKGFNYATNTVETGFVAYDTANKRIYRRVSAPRGQRHASRALAGQCSTPVSDSSNAPQSTSKGQMQQISMQHPQTTTPTPDHDPTKSHAAPTNSDP